MDSSKLPGRDKNSKSLWERFLPGGAPPKVNKPKPISTAPLTRPGQIDDPGIKRSGMSSRARKKMMDEADKY